MGEKEKSTLLLRLLGKLRMLSRSRPLLPLHSPPSKLQLNSNRQPPKQLNKPPLLNKLQLSNKQRLQLNSSSSSSSSISQLDFLRKKLADRLVRHSGVPIIVVLMSNPAASTSMLT